MTRVRVVAGDGWIAHDEHVRPADMASEHFRRQLAERLAWAVQDAEDRGADAAAPRAAAPLAEPRELVAA